MCAMWGREMTQNRILICSSAWLCFKTWDTCMSDKSDVSQSVGRTLVLFFLTSSKIKLRAALILLLSGFSEQIFVH